MLSQKQSILALFILLVFVTGCSVAGEGEMTASPVPPSTAGPDQAVAATALPSAPAAAQPTTGAPPTAQSPASPTQAATPSPTETKVAFEVGQDITIAYLRDLEISGSEITFEQELQHHLSYSQHLVSYISEGNKIYGLLTIPTTPPPEDGFKAIVFNHGYIPPSAYRTTERYTAYVDYLARNGFVVFKIDYRGHGQSQGEPSGSYFSPGYTIDSIAALKSLQTLDFVDPQGIGMWGHSMAGNLVLRAMLIEPDIKAGVIWAGAVYSYDDFALYGIDDNSYRPPATPQTQQTPDSRRRSREIFDTYGRPDTRVDYWKAVSLTDSQNIAYLDSPIQLHHAQDDPVVDIGYSLNLAVVLQANGKPYEYYTYEGGGHNIISPYFEQAMQRTVEFFRKHL